MQEQSEAGSVATLLRQIQVLELTARKNTAGLLAGDYQTAVRGRGMIFHESRKYVPGEPARSIDWNVTARLGEPYVKVNLEERRREVMVLVDVSPSMHAGLAVKTKLEHAVELAATLAVAAVEAGDRVGDVIFADRVLSESRPRGGRAQLFRVLRALVEGAAPWRRPVAVSDPRAAVHALERHRRGRFVVFLISDFIDHDVPEDLKYLRARHDVTLLHVYDPIEYAARGQVVFRGYSPEGAARLGCVRPGETGSLDAMNRFLSEKAARYRIAYESLSTALPVRSALDRLFHLKRAGGRDVALR